MYVLWVDDIRPAPNKDYVAVRSVYEAQMAVVVSEEAGVPFDVIDLDHDAGDFAAFGGDYIKLLDWLEETGRNYKIHLHSKNPVGVQNMRAIIEHNGWKEV